MMHFYVISTIYVNDLNRLKETKELLFATKPDYHTFLTFYLIMLTFYLEMGLHFIQFITVYDRSCQDVKISLPLSLSLNLHLFISTPNVIIIPAKLEYDLWCYVKDMSVKGRTGTPGAAQSISVRPSIENISMHHVWCPGPLPLFLTCHRYISTWCQVVL